MALLVRTWNLFHGNAVPPGREAYLDEMVWLATVDRPDVACLQEIPAWALRRLSGWSGMAAIGDVAAPPRIGPFPSTPTVGRALTSIHHGLLRSTFAGQGNAILVRPELRPRDRRCLVLNPPGFRRREAARLGVGIVARLAWAKERRICQAVRIEVGERTAVVANLHATAFRADHRLADAELLRAAEFATSLAGDDEVCILAGDFNLRTTRSTTLAELTKPEWGFSKPGEGIDHVLVRGATAEAAYRWPTDRRRLAGRLLSDHAPVDVVVDVDGG